MEPIPAQFESRCVLCDDKIYEGEDIVCVEDNWVHANCAVEEGLDLEDL